MFLTFYEELSPVLKAVVIITVLLAVYSSFRYSVAQCDKENCKSLYWMMIVPVVGVAMFAGAYLHYEYM